MIKKYIVTILFSMPKVISFYAVAFCILLQLSCNTKKSNVFNILDQGAKADSKTINTEAIQKTIDACFAAGGGTVYVPPGTFITGTIILKSNINLFLEAGSEIKGSADIKDYPAIGTKSELRNTFLIYAKEANNISILGTGTINGNDSAFIDWNTPHTWCCLDPQLTRQGNSYTSLVPDGPALVKNGDSSRPGLLMGLIDCNDVRIENVTMKNAPNWSAHFACCDGLYISKVKVRNSLLVPNADAFDVSTCKNVIITGCDIVAGDDGIAISPCADGFCKGVAENIVVSDCIIESRSAGIRLGWATEDIRNCSFQNLVIRSNRGICINIRHNERIENIIFDNIIMETKLNTGWWGAAEPIHISEVPLRKADMGTGSIPKRGGVKNIRFSNMMITSEAGMVFYSYHPGSIEDIQLNNIKMKVVASKLNSAYGGNLDLRPAFDNHYAMFKSDIPAIFLHNIKEFSIDGFRLSKSDSLMEFHTNAILGDSSDHILIDRFRGPVLGKASDFPAISLSGRNFSVVNSATTDGSKLQEIRNLK